MIKITREDALEYHRLGGKPGKIAVVPTKPMATQRDLGAGLYPRGGGAGAGDRKRP